MFLLIFGTSCFESDDFDGLIDSRPEISIVFPDRQFDQEVGLGYVATGYNSNPSITYKIQLEGAGGVGIERIVAVEARAANVNIGTCPSFSVIEEDIDASDTGTFEYTRSLDFFTGSDALCDGSLDVPDTYYELIFTLRLTDGQEMVSMQVRGLFKE